MIVWYVPKSKCKRVGFGSYYEWWEFLSCKVWNPSPKYNRYSNRMGAKKRAWDFFDDERKWFPAVRD